MCYYSGPYWLYLMAGYFGVFLSLIIGMLAGIITFGVSWISRKTISNAVGKIVSCCLLIALIGFFAWLEIKCQVAMRVPGEVINGEYRDNDGAVRSLIVATGITLPSIMLGILGILYDWKLSMKSVKA